MPDTASAAECRTRGARTGDLTLLETAFQVCVEGVGGEGKSLEGGGDEEADMHREWVFKIQRGIK